MGFRDWFRRKQAPAAIPDEIKSTLTQEQQDSRDLRDGIHRMFYAQLATFRPVASTFGKINYEDALKLMSSFLASVTNPNILDTIDKIKDDRFRISREVQGKIRLYGRDLMEGVNFWNSWSPPEKNECCGKILADLKAIEPLVRTPII